MIKFLGSCVLVAMTVALVPQTVLAYDVPFQASFTVAFSGSPNTANVTYCGGTAGPIAIEAHGDGFSTFGALAFSLQKTQAGALFHGCLTLTAPNGDTLTATYDAAGTAPPNANHFSPATGTLTFTGGTGPNKNREKIEKMRRLLDAARHGRSLGGFWQHMLVAEGAIEVALDLNSKAWDLAPLGLIVEEAGGRATDVNGIRSIYGGNMVSTNGKIHDEVLALLK